LINTLLEANDLRRRQFLDFATSLPIRTNKKIEVIPIVNSQGEFLDVGELNMPRANTCARRLYLPRFPNEAEFSDVFWKIVESESKFRGFYEWTS